MRQTLSTKIRALVMVICGLPLLAAVSQATSNSAQAAQGDAMVQKIYQCERGLVLPVSYINTQSGGAFAVLQVEGRQIPMQITSSGSGARYLSINQELRYSWHTKGELGVYPGLAPIKKPQKKSKGY
ncbi:MliC family protein [Thiopseudomonas alkaliphila]|uniref:MliC family protein n=1 Tax=Thiopseudomonas alkaliphila TaxID=1697053 RepID=UPI00257866B3|nr:MliC family protein [Thiopseudomonas alkaliphila]MDM1708553.1 MliC family protein [Thiopseudomonas alkaliphila]